MTTCSHRIHLHRPHLNPWLLVAALAAALVGLGSWVIVDRTSSETSQAGAPTHGLASPKTVAMLDARVAALNSGGTKSMAKYYSPTAVFEDLGVIPPIVVSGADAASLNEGYSRMWALAGIRMTRESDVIQAGEYAAYALHLGTTPGITVFEFDADGRITHQWAIGGNQ